MINLYIAINSKIIILPFLFQNHNIEAKVDQLDEINSIKTIDTQHKAEEINDKKTIDTDHKAEKDIAVAVQRQHEKITRYTRDPTILRKVITCLTTYTGCSCTIVIIQHDMICIELS